MTTVYFVRHGTTEANEAGRFQGITDIPLGEMGKKQADALAERFRGMKLDAVYCSPLLRARQTAAGICRYLSCQPTVVDGLREVNGGVLENRTNADNERRFPGSMTTLRTNPTQFAPPEGETGREVWERVRATVDRLVAQHPNGAFVIVSHGFALMTCLGTIDCPFDEMKPRMVSNASVTTVTFAPPEQPTFVEYNSTAHLPEEALFRSKFWREDSDGQCGA